MNLPFDIKPLHRGIYILYLVDEKGGIAHTRMEEHVFIQFAAMPQPTFYPNAKQINDSSSFSLKNLELTLRRVNKFYHMNSS